MKNLECIIFNVEHGFSAFIKSPNNYGLLIDCGSRDLFSPVKWIRTNYNIGKGNIAYFSRRRIAQTIITHLHSDHFDDVGSFIVNKEDNPKQLTRDKDNLVLLNHKIKTLEEGTTKNVLLGFKHFQEKYSEKVKDIIPWGFDFFKYDNISLKDAKEINENPDKIINNRSYIIGVGYAGKKILFPGDIEVEGWQKALTYKSIKDIISNTNFFITSHHGHKSGFTSDILKYSGIPDIFIISARRGDEHVDTSYSKIDFAKGFVIKGEQEKSLSISTKTKNKSIKITIWENGKSEIETIETPDNLDSDQKKIIRRKTKDFIINKKL